MGSDAPPDEADEAPPTLTTEELAAIASRQKFRNVLALTSAVFTAVATIALVIVAVAIFIAQARQERADAAAACRAEIGSVYSQLTDDRDNAFQRAVVLSFGGERDAARLIVEQELTPLVATIELLPKRSTAYDKGLDVGRVVTAGLTIDAEHLPPCPKVS